MRVAHRLWPRQNIFFVLRSSVPCSGRSLHGLRTLRQRTQAGFEILQRSEPLTWPTAIHYATIGTAGLQCGVAIRPTETASVHVTARGRGGVDVCCGSIDGVPVCRKRSHLPVQPVKLRDAVDHRHSRPRHRPAQGDGITGRWQLSKGHSELRPQPIGNSAGDLCRRLVGDREHRTGVDLAKHVAVGPVEAGRAEHEVRVPDHR